MKVLTLWLWAFGFAINKLLGENNLEKEFYVYELNKDVVTEIKATRKHPFFFKWYKLPENIKIIDDYEDIIWDVDLLIIAIPAQFIENTIQNWNKKLKNGITILNLAKWIDIKSNMPISKVLEKWLDWLDFNYSILSWWMIASELVEWKQLWADLWISDLKKWEEIKKLLENNTFTVELRENILNIELYWSLKNIMAILVGYYEWKWLEKSSIWYYMLEFYNEMKDIIQLYWWDSSLDFSYYSLWWDIVATCFGNSRNRYFWQLLWKWNSIGEVLDTLRLENKHAEGYETLKAVYSLIKDKDWFEQTKFLYGLIK